MQLGKRRLAFVVLGAVPIVVAVACGDEASKPQPSIVNITTADSGHDATTDSDVVDAGEPDTHVDCPTVAPDPAAGTFVAPFGVTANTCGTRETPCKTVALGIARAKATAKAKVFVARGTYAESIELSAGIELEGGWDVLANGDWNRACVDVSDMTLLRAGAAQNATVNAKNLGGTAKLTRLRIESKAAASVAAGESVYGVFAVGASTTLELTDVNIIVGAGGAGAAGRAGTTGAAGGASCATPSTGAAGAGGAAGSGAGAGSFDDTGYVSTRAEDGGAGAPGENGGAGGAGLCVTCGSCDVAPDCTFVPSVIASGCGDDGKPGCGGAAGGGGERGQSGGSSIGVFAQDATVTIVGGRVKAADGGTGGAGGASGRGGTGAAGSVGALALPCVVACAPHPTDTTLCVETTGRGAGGTAGGVGGAGGAGGAGGGGAGGWSVAILQGGAGVVTTTNTTLEFGKAGRGGGPDGGAGAAGAAAARIP